MFINQYVVIATIFRLINFFIVIALAIYAFKKYVMPIVLVLIAKKDAEKEFLFSQQILLEQKQYELDTLIKQDIIRCESLKVKIDEWRRIVDKEYVAQENNRTKIRIAIEDSNNQKMQLQEHARIEKIVTEKVIT